ncbi:hypothetical protein L1049_020128 [Liquidambar formosana]|uniref:Uncharacterized protein n=1 Tax=Liquidambar formosana TaxID=63359 RepID=A0AAP0SAV7_LIQFO
MTIFNELPISIEMIKRNVTGIWEFTDVGVVSHNEISEMYWDYIIQLHMEEFLIEELAKVIIAQRSNNKFDATKLKQEFLTLPLWSHSNSIFLSAKSENSCSLTLWVLFFCFFCIYIV